MRRFLKDSVRLSLCAASGGLPFGRQLADERRADDQRRAEQGDEGERLMQHGGGKQQREYRIDIAQNGDGLRLQPLHAAKVQSIGQARMDGTYEQHHGDRACVQPDGRKILGQQQIGQERDGGADELDGRPPVGIVERDFLVQYDDGGIERGGPQAEEHTGQIARARRGLVCYARNEDHAGDGSGGAQEPAAREALMQKERREQYDDGGLHIVAHGGCGDGGIICRLRRGKSS